MTRERVAGLALAAILGALGALSTTFVARNWDALRPLAEGDRVAPFVLADADDKNPPVDLSNLAGKAVLIDFWATWCGPCERTMPLLARLHERHHARGLEIVSVSLDSGPNRARVAERYRQRLRLPYPVYLDDGVVSERFQVGPIPHLVLLGPDLRVRLVHVGALGLDALEANLDREVTALLGR